MIRFDDITREERYFSATVLPYLLAYQGFEGLKGFVNELYRKKYLNDDIILDIAKIQLLTEIDLERDLSHYNIEIPVTAFKLKLATQSKPDLLVIAKHFIFLFECKLFQSESEYQLYQQIQKQKYVFDIIEHVTQINFENKLHFLVLPYEFDIPDCIVITWSQIIDIFENIVPPDDYFFQRLQNADKRLMS